MWNHGNHYLKFPLSSPDVQENPLEQELFGNDHSVIAPKEAATINTTHDILGDDQHLSLDSSDDESINLSEMGEDSETPSHATNEDTGNPIGSVEATLLEVLSNLTIYRT